MSNDNPWLPFAKLMTFEWKLYRLLRRFMRRQRFKKELSEKEKLQAEVKRLKAELKEAGGIIRTYHQRHIRFREYIQNDQDAHKRFLWKDIGWIPDKYRKENENE